VSDHLSICTPAIDPIPPVARKRRRLLSPLLVDAKGLSKLLSVGVRTVRTWDAAGKLPAPLRVGGRVLWSDSEVKAWIRAKVPDRETWATIREARR
jgi:excisionase family DNA binding protein